MPRSMRSRASVENLTSFADMALNSRWLDEMRGGSGGLALERDHAFNDAHHIRFLHDDEVLAVDLDLCAGPLPEQDAIASLHIERYELAALIASPRPGGDDLPFLRLLLRGIRNDDATLRLLFSVDAADHDAVVQGAKFHGYFLRHAPVPATICSPGTHIVRVPKDNNCAAFGCCRPAARVAE